MAHKKKLPDDELPHEKVDLEYDPGCECPACGAISDFDAVVCVRCGQPLPWSAFQAYNSTYHKNANT